MQCRCGRLPGPSELYRSEEYKKLEESRNIVCDTAKDVTRLVALKVQLKDGYFSKHTKSKLLEEVRLIEKRLGIDSKSYNSGEF